MVIVNCSRQLTDYQSRPSGQGQGGTLPIGKHKQADQCDDLLHNVTETGRTTTAAIDTKYALNRFWNVMPRLQADYTSPLLENSPQWVASPAVKMEYRPNKLFGLQIEAGGKWLTGENSTADNSSSSYFMNLKYQAKF
jgi:hypothetical protein